MLLYLFAILLLLCSVSLYSYTVCVCVCVGSVYTDFLSLSLIFSYFTRLHIYFRVFELGWRKRERDVVFFLSRFCLLLIHLFTFFVKLFLLVDLNFFIYFVDGYFLFLGFLSTLKNV